eukprot:TRINITY_DN8045_c0_g1_i4.p1 TRINITY_DN8045_c0_g1~~TRINITY_DN8045_c0_g1_i4.p1  ORF type:complete len:117 (-),score=6.01 TRINITY_DN8045_c0_g1_i4:325-675(-)
MCETGSVGRRNSCGSGSLTGRDIGATLRVGLRTALGGRVGYDQSDGKAVEVGRERHCPREPHCPSPDTPRWQPLRMRVWRDLHCPSPDKSLMPSPTDEGEGEGEGEGDWVRASASV